MEEWELWERHLDVEIQVSYLLTRSRTSFVMCKSLQDYVCITRTSWLQQTSLFKIPGLFPDKINISQTRK